MIKFAQIVYIPMTGVGINRGFKDDAWFKDRIEIFKKFTLKSLINQEAKGFLTWMSFRPEEENHPYVKELDQYLKDIKFPHIFTFDGLMYWDDKFNKNPKQIFMNCARVLRQAWREKNFTKVIPNCLEAIFGLKNRSLLNRLERSLYRIRTKEFGLLDANYIFMTRIDSDDMLHKSAIAEMQRIQPFEGVLAYKNGYVFNSNTNEMATWNPKTNPPFHTICFLGSKFFNPVEHLRTYGDYRSHEDIAKMNPKYLEDGRYCVVIHNKHISTVWNHPFKGDELGENATAEKLKEFYGE